MLTVKIDRVTIGAKRLAVKGAFKTLHDVARPSKMEIVERVTELQGDRHGVLSYILGLMKNPYQFPNIASKWKHRIDIAMKTNQVVHGEIPQCKNTWLRVTIEKSYTELKQKEIK